MMSFHFNASPGETVSGFSILLHMGQFSQATTVNDHFSFLSFTPRKELELLLVNKSKVQLFNDDFEEALKRTTLTASVLSKYN